jgi:hypothetical protein
MFKYSIPFVTGIYVGQEYTKIPRIKDETTRYIKEIQKYLENLK